MHRGRYGSALILAAALAGLGVSNRAAIAQFVWDPQQTPTTPSGGSGTWDNTTFNWATGPYDVAWNSANAYFGGPGRRGDDRRAHHRSMGLSQRGRLHLLQFHSR